MAKREGGDKEAPLAFPSSLSFLGSLWNTTSTWHPPRGNLILKWWNKMLICFQMSLPINVCLLLEWKIEKHGSSSSSSSKRGTKRKRLSNSLQTTRQSSQIRLPIHCSITATTASLENDIDRKFFDIRSFFFCYTSKRSRRWATLLAGRRAVARAEAGGKGSTYIAGARGSFF